MLETPPPSVLFLGFGDSSLNVEVRAFVAGLSKRMPTTHELHMALDQALREHNIEIAFPQRDLHLRSGWPPAPPDAPPDASPAPPPTSDDPAAPATEPAEVDPDKPSPDGGRS